jgi:hypothetical protein
MFSRSEKLRRELAESNISLDSSEAQVLDAVRRELLNCQSCGLSAAA